MIKEKLEELWWKILDIYNCYIRERHTISTVDYYKDKEGKIMIQHCFCGRVLGYYREGIRVFIDTQKEEIIEDWDNKDPLEEIINVEIR